MQEAVSVSVTKSAWGLTSMPDLRLPAQWNCFPWQNIYIYIFPKHRENTDLWFDLEKSINIIWATISIKGQQQTVNSV